MADLEKAKTFERVRYNNFGAIPRTWGSLFYIRRERIDKIRAVLGVHHEADRWNRSMGFEVSIYLPTRASMPIGPTHNVHLGPWRASAVLRGCSRELFIWTRIPRVPKHRRW